MIYILLKCAECEVIDEIACDSDSPLFCPNCRTVDNFEEVEE